MFQLLHDYHARFCSLTSFVSLGVFSLTLFVHDWLSSLSCTPVRGYVLVLIFIEALRILTHGLWLVINFLSIRVLWSDWFRSVSFFFSFNVIARCEPCFNFGAAISKTAFGLYVLVYLLACTQHALGPAWGAQAPPSTPMLYGLVTFFPMTMRYLELAISLFGASVHFCLCSFLRPKFFCSTKYMHFSVADNIKYVVRSAAYIQYRTSSHIHHGLQRIALSLMFLRNSVRLQCSAERYCTRVYYFVVHWLLLELLRMSH
jgi:hypothetical protein